MNFTSGKHSSFDVNSIHYDGKGWSVEPAGQEVRTDNTSTNGFSDRIVAVKDLKVTLEFEWDCSQNLMSSAPTFKIGTVLSILRLYLDFRATEDADDANYWTLPSAIVLTTPMQAKVGDVIKWTVTVGNKGAFTAPTGSFVPSAFGVL